MSSRWPSSLLCSFSASTFTRMAASGVRNSCATSAIRLRSRVVLSRTRSSRLLMLCTIGLSSLCGGVYDSGVRSSGPRSAVSRLTWRHGRSASRTDSQAGKTRNGRLITSGSR
ncbi:hypothetical protein FQZ97_1108980 [compost metagenome]